MTQNKQIEPASLTQAYQTYATRIIEGSRDPNLEPNELIGDTDAYNIACAGLAISRGERFKPIWEAGLLEQHAIPETVARCSQALGRDALRKSAARTVSRKHHYKVGAHTLSDNISYRPRIVPKKIG